MTREELRELCEDFGGDAEKFKEIVFTFLDLEKSGVTKLAKELGVSILNAEKLAESPETLSPMFFNQVVSGILRIIDK